METCQNFYIRQSLITPETRLVYFEGECIGYISPNPEGGFVVEPAGKPYSAIFGNMECACLELIFHVYSQTRKISYC